MEPPAEATDPAEAVESPPSGADGAHDPIDVSHFKLGDLNSEDRLIATDRLHIGDPRTCSISPREGKITTKVQIELGDRTTSDVVVRIRTPEGRDNWLYCHSEILVEKSKYFADRLSDDWPTCQILDSRYCVEVHCQELEFNSYVSALRLFYVPEPQSWHGVRNTLGILQVAVQLGCPQIAGNCMNYLEAVPWEEAEEEEILKTIPNLGSQYEQILARLRPVDPTALIGFFISTLRFATSSPPATMLDIKSTAQDQLDYMLTEDDDAPFLPLDNEFVKVEVKNCVVNLFARFNLFIESMLHGSNELVDLNWVLDYRLFLSDISWVCQILNKMDSMRVVIDCWMEASVNIIKASEANTNENLECKLKVVEVVVKVLEGVGFGHVVVPMPRRLQLVQLWLPFVQKAWHLVDQIDFDSPQEVSLPFLCSSEIWQSIESAIVSLILTLPSGNQAEILAEWLRSENVRYPDLTEAYEVWCYRSKVAKRRFTVLDNSAN